MKQAKVGTALCVVPWLEGGGGQSAFFGILRQAARAQTDIVILFRGSRNHDEVYGLARSVRELDLPRTPLGVIRAAMRLRGILASYDSCYSLMRASHVVLGLTPARLRRKRIAASFHQLPSTDRSSPVARFEEWAIRRALRRAELVTAPSARAVRELTEYRLAPARALRVEENAIRRCEAPPVSPGLRPNEVRLLAAGRISRQKGLDQLPSLLESVGRPVILRIAGTGEQLEALQAVTWPPNVTPQFLGHIDDIYPELDWCDAVIMPSRWELNPQLVWEAWSRGRFVIASDLQVFRDLNDRGPMVCFSSPEDLGRKLARISLESAALAAFESGPEARARESGRIARFLGE